MKRVKYISSAEGNDESKLSMMLDDLKDDFDYIISGLEKLDRTSAESSNNGLIIAEKFQSEIQEVISQIGDNLS